MCRGASHKLFFVLNRKYHIWACNFWENEKNPKLWVKYFPQTIDSGVKKTQRGVDDFSMDTPFLKIACVVFEKILKVCKTRKKFKSVSNNIKYTKPNLIQIHYTCFCNTRILIQNAKQDNQILNQQRKTLRSRNKAENL